MSRYIPFLIGGGIVLVWLVAPFAVGWLYPVLEQRGQFGDLFGSVNALFSGLAFAGLLYNVTLQRKQMQLQREELALQREELRMQRLEMAGSRTQLANQVRMQRALIKATIAQVTVASAQAHIEHAKIESQASYGGHDADFSASIKARATALSELSKHLEASIPEIDAE